MSNFQELDVSLKTFGDLNTKLDGSINNFNQWFEQAQKEYNHAIGNCNDKIESLDNKEHILNRTQDRINEIVSLVDETKNEISNLIQIKTDIALKIVELNEKTENEISNLIQFKNDIQLEIDKKVNEFFDSTKLRIEKFINDETTNFNEFKTIQNSSFETFTQKINKEVVELQSNFEKEKNYTEDKLHNLKRWIFISSIILLFCLLLTVLFK